MRALHYPLALTLATGAALAIGSPANAAPVCAGTANTATFCASYNKGAIPKVDPDGSTYDDCIYLGSGPCTPVSIPIPTVTPGSGELVSLSCGGPLIDPFLTCR